MSIVLIIILVVVALVVVLAVGGAIAQRRRMERNREAFAASLEQVNQELAEAHAADRGWERAALETAAREAYGRERPGAPAPELVLVRIVDRPGTDEDKAIFRTGEEYLTLGRRDGAWALESLT